VLDVGCGQGALVNYLPQFGATTFGVDISSISLRRAARGAAELGHSDSVHLSVGDAECLPFPDACFDAVLSFGVLHHTPNSDLGVKELWRVLKRHGLAIVMLYRSSNPKWWMVRLIRGFSRFADFWTGGAHVIATRFREKRSIDDRRGTALVELFGVPILKAFSNRQAYEMFSLFSKVRISNHQPGFGRMVDIVPTLKLAEPFLRCLDQQIKGVSGFYQVIAARK